MEITAHCTECNELTMSKKSKLCRKHSNIKSKESRLKKWRENPLVQKAHEIWQIAYADSARTFKVSCGISQGVVYVLLVRHNISNGDTRLVPLDPMEPLSLKNYCFTSTANKNDMCRAWRLLQSPKDYRLFISLRETDAKRPVYGSSMEDADI